MYDTKQKIAICTLFWRSGACGVAVRQIGAKNFAGAAGGWAAVCIY
jgi:hypothetical protein